MSQRNELLFLNEYQKLTETEKERFSRIGSKLLNKTFIIKQKDVDREDYFFVVGHLTLFKAYFSFIDYDVVHYEADMIVALETCVNRNRLRLKRTETIILLILRLLYQRKLKEATQLNRILISVGELHEEIEKTGLIKGRLTKTDLQNSMRVFKSFSLVDYISQNLFNDETKIEIYPSLLRVVNIDDLIKLEALLKEYASGGDDDEETFED